MRFNQTSNSTLCPANPQGSICVAHVLVLFCRCASRLRASRPRPGSVRSWTLGFACVAGIQVSLSLRPWCSRGILGPVKRSPRRPGSNRPTGKFRGPLRVVIVAAPGPDAGDLFGPLDILRYASQFALQHDPPPGHGYAIEVVSSGRAKTLVEAAGVRITAERTYREIEGPIDTLLLMPIDESQLHDRDPAFNTWLAKAAGKSRRVAGLCTGAFLLGQAGLLEDRRATTHWAFCDELRRQFPNTEVDADPIFVRDGHIYTSAGAMAGMDLVLALVEEDLGPEIARQVARFLVLFLRRPGGQSQFSTQLQMQFAQRKPVRKVQDWINDNLHADLSVEALAQRAAMSERNFRRVFAREVGIGPAKYVERVRVESAQRRLEETADGTEAVAAACGFVSAEQMRCAFLRVLGVGPAVYRSRFSSSRRPDSTIPGNHSAHYAN
jgi:transcriptional regulator GlxA family with amidase domain